MGYEVVYKYHEEISKGEYNKEESHVSSIKVGDPFEDVSLEVLVGKVMSLLARRNILVVDVEIFELQKKKITFKEAKDGVIIKNKKYKFDDGPIFCGESVSENSDPAAELLNLLKSNPDLLSKLGVQPHQILKNTSTTPSAQPTTPPSIVKPATAMGKILRYEVYYPTLDGLAESAKRRKLAFTMNKKYPIYEERKPEDPRLGLFYVTIDDNGQKQIMNDKFFIPEEKPLLRDDPTDPFIKVEKSSIKLIGDDVQDYPMPKLR